jgi:hypothetical protein
MEGIWRREEVGMSKKEITKHWLGFNVRIANSVVFKTTFLSLCVPVYLPHQQLNG